MRGGGAQRVAPAPARPAGRGAAIDDQPLAPDRHLEGQRAGMGEAIGAARQPGRRIPRRRGGGAPASADHDRAPGLQAVEAASPPVQRRAAPRLALGEHQLDQRGRLLPRAVEQRQAAIAMAEQAQRLARALQHRGQRRRRRVHPGAVQQVADLDQVLHRQQELSRRAALDMAAIGVELALQFARQEAQRAGQPAPPPPAPPPRRSRPSA